MLISTFLFRERVQNAKFLKSKFLLCEGVQNPEISFGKTYIFCKGVQYDLFFS